MMPIMRFAIIDFFEPGEPIISSCVYMTTNFNSTTYAVLAFYHIREIEACSLYLSEEIDFFTRQYEDLAFAS